MLCLRSLSANDYPNYRVLLIVNGATSVRPSELQEQFSNVEILWNRENTGFSAGNNQGLRYAAKRGAQYFWLLNNDTEVEEQSLSALIRAAESEPAVGAVGSVILEPEAGRAVQAWGGGRVSFFTGLPRHVKKADIPLDYLCGASLLLKSKALRSVGLLDPGFFLYWEDTDLSFRLREGGWKLAVAANSRVVHRGSHSSVFQSPSYDYHFTVSSVRFFRRHAPWWPLPVAISVLGKVLRRAATGKLGNAGAILLGLRKGMR